MLMPIEMPTTEERVRPSFAAVETVDDAALPAKAKVPFVARFLPSLTDIAFLMPIIFLFVKFTGARGLLGDGDTGWHIRTGEWILNHHQVPLTDLFSFSRPGAPWFAWEWLWDVMFALLFRSGGLAAVVLASTLVICLTCVALFRLVRRKCDSGLVAIAVTLLAIGGCSTHWLARPHLFTALFFALTLHITDRASKGHTKLLAWLIPLTLVWTNIHGGFFIIFLVFPCYIASNLVNALIERDPAERRAYLSRTTLWIVTMLGCLAATFINPYGWQLHKHVLAYITDPYNLNHISEFQSLDFHSPISLYFEPMVVGALAAALWVARQRRFAETFLALGWLHLALIAQRNVPLFVVAAAPLVAEGIAALLHQAKTSPLASYIGKAANWFQAAGDNVEQTDRIPRVYLVSAAAFGVIALLMYAPKPLNERFMSSFDPKIFPVGAVEALESPETHRIWAQDQWGDYLIYRLSSNPKMKVFVDGRSDFYGDAFGEEYLQVLDVQVGWDKILNRYGIDTVMLSPGLALCQAMKISSEWRVIFDDHQAVVFRRNAPAPSSFASDDEGRNRDRAIAKTNQPVKSLITSEKKRTTK